MTEGAPVHAQPGRTGSSVPGEEWDAAPTAAALAESEERFRLAMDHSAVAMNITGPDGRFLRINAAMSRLLNRAPHDLLTRTWQELTHPDDLANDEALVADLTSGARDHYRLLKRFLRPDGTVVWGDLTVSCVRAEDGSVDYFVAQIVDITEWQAAVIALRRSEELLSAVMDQAPVAMGVATLDGSFVRVNRGLADFFGRSSAELLATTWQALSDAGSLPDEAVMVAELLAGRRDSYRLLKRFRRADGAERYGLLSVSCMCDEDGSPQLLVGQIVDVTSREEALGRLRATLDSMLDPHALFEPVRDAGGRLVDVRYAGVNDTGAAYLGRAREELVGARVSRLFGGPAVAALLSWCESALVEGRFAADDVPLVTAEEGEERWFDVRAAAVGDSVSLSWRDVTTRHRVNEDLAASEAAYRLLADHATDVIIRTDFASGIVFVSPSVKEILGWAPDDLIGRRVSDLMHPDDLAQARRQQ